MTAKPVGVVPILKLPGPTSHDVVARARKIFGTREVGHGGTLDPAAAGVLPLLVGSATRLARYLLLGDKAYRFTVTFGAETDTGDQEGSVVRRAPLPPPEAVEAAAASLTGRVRQRPPAHSALHASGRRAHRLARAGRDVELAEREVEVARLAVVGLEPGPEGRVRRASFDLVCSHGTYVRTLGVDLARRAGTAGHVSALLRTRTGPFSLASARTLAEVAAEPSCLPPEAALADHRQVALARHEAMAVRHGRLLPALAVRLGAPRPGLEHDVGLLWAGRLLAVAGGDGGRWRLRAVFPAETT